jgi:hypothetical protein
MTVMVLQITTRRSRAGRVRRPLGAWPYALMILAGLALAIVMAIHPLKL